MPIPHSLSDRVTQFLMRRRPRERWPKELKAEILLAARSTSVSVLARELGLTPQVIYAWQRPDALSERGAAAQVIEVVKTPWSFQLALRWRGIMLQIGE